MKLHEIELDDRYEKPVIKRRKQFEIRNNDRNYKVGDVLVMLTSKKIIYCIVTYVLLDFSNIEPGYAGLGIDLLG